MSGTKKKRKKSARAVPDFRLYVDYFRHPKTRALRRVLGADGVVAHLELWAWVTTPTNGRTLGDLTGMTDEAIEGAADWRGEPGALVAELVRLKWLDGDEGQRQVHEWVPHQPWAAEGGARVEQARNAAHARWSKETDEECSQHAGSNAPGPEIGAAASENAVPPRSLDPKIPRSDQERADGSPPPPPPEHPPSAVAPEGAPSHPVLAEVRVERDEPAPPPADAGPEQPALALDPAFVEIPTCPRARDPAFVAVPESFVQSLEAECPGLDVRREILGLRTHAIGLQPKDRPYASGVASFIRNNVRRAWERQARRTNTGPIAPARASPGRGDRRLSPEEEDRIRRLMAPKGRTGAYRAN